jgi:hypothetical protein
MNLKANPKENRNTRAGSLALNAHIRAERDQTMRTEPKPSETDGAQSSKTIRNEFPPLDERDKKILVALTLLREARHTAETFTSHNDSESIAVLIDCAMDFLDEAALRPDVAN